MLRPAEFEMIDSFCLPYQKQRISEATSAHTESHLLDVASLSDLAAQARKFSFRIRELVRISSLMHDVQRLPTEDPKIKGDQLSAKAAVELMDSVDGKGIFPNTLNEREAVAFAIKNQGKYPDWFKDEKTREIPPQTLKEELWESLFLGDKMTQNGVWVIARRSAFVAGNRLQAGGDLQDYGFRPKSEDYRGDEEMVVILESAIRLTFINPQGIYPAVFKPIVDPLYKVQREFVLGLCQANGMDQVEIAKMLFEKRRPDGKNILQVRGINFNEYTELAKLIGKQGGIIAKAIDKVSPDKASSATEAVRYFSARYKDDLIKTVLIWKPKGKYAQGWQQGMAEYLDGTWYKSVEDKLNE